MNDNQSRNLKLDIFKQATLYIEDMGHFAPFASSIANDTVTPIGYYSDEDPIDMEKAIEILQEQLSKKIKTGLAEGAAFAFDVRIDAKNGDGILEKRDAMCLRISEDGDNWEQGYFPYRIINGECIWK